MASAACPLAATARAIALARTQRPLLAHDRLYSTGPSYNQYGQQQQPPPLHSQQPFPQYFPPQPPPPPPPPKKRRILRSTYVFLTLGLLTGSITVFAVYGKRSPPKGKNVRGSEAERQAKEHIAQVADEKILLVKQLQADPDWDEWDVGQRWREIEAAEAAEAAENAQTNDSIAGGELVDVADVSADVTPLSSSRTLPRKVSLSNEGGSGAIQPPTPQRTRLTTGAMGGLRGMGAYHRIFHNRTTGQIVSILRIGDALSGWPTVVHGGAIATILDEALGRCAILSFPARTGVTARLELQYRSPVKVNNFYVVTCTPLLPDEYKNNKDGKDSNGKELRKLWCEATLDTLEGKRCVEARGLFVVPRKYKLGKVEDKF